MDVKVAHVHKAQPIGADKTPNLNISATEELPNFTELGRITEFAKAEAAELESALYRTLPGATYDQLLAAMLARRASHFRVPFWTAD